MARKQDDTLLTEQELAAAFIDDDNDDLLPGFNDDNSRSNSTPATRSDDNWEDEADDAMGQLAVDIPAVKILMTCFIMLIIAVLPVPSQEITEVSAPPHLVAAKATLGIKTLPAITVAINTLITIFLFVIKFSLIPKL